MPSVAPRQEAPEELPTPAFAIWQEVISVLAHLTPKEVARLVITARWGGSASSRGRMRVWRAYFMLLWGAEYGATRETQVRVMRSWVGIDALPAPWPLAVGFCGACSAADHMFWFLPVVRCALQIDRPERHPPLTPSVAWQVACHVRHRGHRRLWRCFECDVLEVVPAGSVPQHFRQHWVLPCGRCQRYAHRACLERRLLAAWADAGNSSSTPRLRCALCSREYCTSKRFAETLPELLWATRQEWRWVTRRVFITLCFFSWIYTLAEHYVTKATASAEVFVVLLFTATIMSISVCPRFHRGVQMIWNTPNKWRYLRFFGLYFLLCHMVVFRALEPSQWESFAVQKPWLAGVHKLHVLVHSSFSGMIFLSGFSLMYISTASGAIFLFWKTSLRVPTVASADVREQGGLMPKLASSGSQCGLCQLGLCLDNDIM